MNMLSKQYTASALLFACLSSAPAFAITDLNVTWLDNSDNEDGFIIEKTVMSNPNYQKIADLPANETNYVDFQIVSGETYCYRVSAYNSAGTAQSSEKCLKVEDNTSPEPTPNPTPDLGEINITSSFVAKAKTTEIDGKEFYGFKSELYTNEDYSNEAIENVSFTTGNGSVSYRDSDITFTDQGSEIENGYAGVSFNTDNNLNFDLVGSGAEQNATLYMKVGAWTNDATAIVVTAGNTVHNVVIPRGYTWHYVAINIAYTQTTSVNVTTNTNAGGYSSVQFNGLVLNEEAPVSMATLADIDMNADTEVDVTNVKYISANEVQGNDSLSNAEVVKMEYLGSTEYRDNTFSFMNNGEKVAQGYQGMSWNESNGAAVGLKGDGSTEHTASFYIKAGAWTNDTAQISVVINGVEELIELPGTRSWYTIKVDVNFTGTADVVIKPRGVFGSYSKVSFGGILLN